MPEPAEPAYGALDKEKGIYNYKLTKWLKESDQWEETNNKLYIRLMLHCLPSMETKLESMARFKAVMNNLDGLELINPRHKVYGCKELRSQSHMG